MQETIGETGVRGLGRALLRPPHARPPCAGSCDWLGRASSGDAVLCALLTVGPSVPRRLCVSRLFSCADREDGHQRDPGEQSAPIPIQPPGYPTRPLTSNPQLPHSLAPISKRSRAGGLLVEHGPPFERAADIFGINFERVWALFLGGVDADAARVVGLGVDCSVFEFTQPRPRDTKRLELVPGIAHAAALRSV
jgi:hypothetical protein